MSEIAKEIPESKETTFTENVNAPEFKLTSDIDLEKADSIYKRIAEDGANDGNETKEDANDLEKLLDDLYGYSVDDFSFEQVEIDWDDEELEQYINFFVPQEWKLLDPAEKQLVIEGFGMYLAKLLDLKNPPKVKFYYGPEYECGSYTRATNTIQINMNSIDSERHNVIGTIAHEMWHAYQWQRAESPTTPKDGLYAINFTNPFYINPMDSFDLYESQLVEAEANAFAKMFEERVGEKECLS